MIGVRHIGASVSGHLFTSICTLYSGRVSTNTHLQSPSSLKGDKGLSQYSQLVKNILILVFNSPSRCCRMSKIHPSSNGDSRTFPLTLTVTARNSRPKVCLQVCTLGGNLHKHEQNCTLACAAFLLRSAQVLIASKQA